MNEKKRIARALAKALIALDLADWRARDWKVMSNCIREARLLTANLFTSTGYEFSDRGGSHIRRQRNA